MVQNGPWVDVYLCPRYVSDRAASVKLVSLRPPSLAGKGVYICADRAE